MVGIFISEINDEKMGKTNKWNLNCQLIFLEFLLEFVPLAKSIRRFLASTKFWSISLWWPFPRFFSFRFFILGENWPKMFLTFLGLFFSSAKGMPPSFWQESGHLLGIWHRFRRLPIGEQFNEENIKADPFIGGFEFELECMMASL